MVLFYRLSADSKTKQVINDMIKDFNVSCQGEGVNVKLIVRTSSEKLCCIFVKLVHCLFNFLSPTRIRKLPV